MKPFFAILRLTFRNALRSHIFQMLLGVLLLCVVVIPATVNDDGTAFSFIQVSLLYSLSAVLLLLALSSIWLGCYMMSHDIDGYQLHLIVAKPVSRVTIWLGKYCGILLLDALLLCFSAAVIYGIILYKFSRSEFSEEERARIANEVLVGRRVFMPQLPDYDRMAHEALDRKYREQQMKGESFDTSPEGQQLAFQEIRRQLVAQQSELPFRQSVQWRYTGLPVDLDTPLYLRYRAYVGKVDSKDQRQTAGVWSVLMPRVVEAAKENTHESADRTKFESFWVPMSQAPETFMCGNFTERALLPEWKLVAPDGTLTMGFINFDPQQEQLYFQQEDGPKLLLRKTGFLGNYLRCVAVIFLELAILTGLACAAAGILTMPTAVFVVLSYLLVGSIATYLMDTAGEAATDQFGRIISSILLMVVIPIQEFEVTHLVADGELIEFSLLWKLVWSYLLARALPLFLLGIWLYRKRELGLVIRK